MSDEPGREAPSDLLAARRRKLEGLRAEGIDPFPYAYPGVVPIGNWRPDPGVVPPDPAEIVTYGAVARVGPARSDGPPRSDGDG